ncbi:MAG: hypothetical protein ISR65_17185 [Bacteriovoracaceae bacterium]|nr:hypothetical protein [Bacteriovoracaceae bacterium]
MNFLILLLFITITTFTNIVKADDVKEYYYFSAETLQEDLSFDPFVQLGGPLGSFGVLGAYGPLGSLGPYSNDSILKAFDWSSFSDYLTKKNGPLSNYGPLGSKGPNILSTNEGYEMLESFNKTAANYLAMGGPLHILGPFGLLGVKGIMGPLGINGATGFKRDRRAGNFIDKAKQSVRTIKLEHLEFDHEQLNSNKDFDLYELYESDFAQNMSGNDTSFGVISSIRYYQEKSFEFNSKDEQLVSIAVVPEYQLDDFKLTLTVENDGETTTIETDSKTLIDFVVIKVKKNTKITATIELAQSWHFLSNKKFRLFVGGSGPVLETEVKGSHQRAY